MTQSLLIFYSIFGQPKGYVQCPPSDLLPGYIEAISGHKIGITATGCEGTISWSIPCTNQMLVVLYSVPFNHDLYKNWLAFGIFDKESTTDYFSKMYQKIEPNKFASKMFYEDVSPIKFINDDFIIKGQMGSNHKPIIQIKILPTRSENLASSSTESDTETLI